MKKIFVLLFCIIIAGSLLSGCIRLESDASEDASEDEEEATTAAQGMKIAYFVSELDNEYQQSCAEQAQDYAMEKYGAVVSVVNGDADTGVMALNIALLATSKYGGASLQVWDTESMQDDVLAAIDAGIAIISYGDELADTGVPVYCSDEAAACFEMGAAAARKWVETKPDRPIVTVQLVRTDCPGQQENRADPFVQGIESVVGAGNYTNLGVIECEKSESEAQRLLGLTLEETPGINIIFSAATALTPGCMEALTEADRGILENGEPYSEIVVGAELDLEELKDIYGSDSSLKLSLGLPPKDISHAVIDLLVSVICGETEQVSQPAHEVLGSAFVCNYWDTPVEDAYEWYTTQFDINNDEFTISTITGEEEEE